MAPLNDHFKHTAYAIHRSAWRKERLPSCCREGLYPLGIGIRFLTKDGCDTVLPLYECAVCTRKFAVIGNRFMAVDNLMQYDVVTITK